MISSLYSGFSGFGLSPLCDQCFVFLNKTLYFQTGIFGEYQLTTGKKPVKSVEMQEDNLCWTSIPSRKGSNNN